MTKTFKKRHGKRHHRHTKRHHTGKNKRMIKRGFKMVKSTSRKYMPAVKSGLEGVGSKVTKTATKSVPVLQKATRDIFSMFGMKKKR